MKSTRTFFWQLLGVLSGVLLLGGVPAFAQTTDRPVSGRVTDEAGAALPGVNVSVKGTPRGLTTDAEGRYRLSVPEGAVLVFSSVGYATREVVLGNQTTVDVTLLADTRALDEVVVIGYGEQRRREVTGSVASVSARQIENIPVPGVDQALAGQLAGVQVQQTTGAPGGTINVRVRGTGSIGAGSEPLYVVDGFPGVTNLNAINPNDIQSIEVLKDASAAAIYGSRGANGVVIITTKQGRTGKTTFRFDAYTGIQNVTKKLDLLNATEYAEHFIRAKNNQYADAGGITDLTVFKNSRRLQNNQILPVFLLNDSSNVVNPALGVGTDWQDAIFRQAPVSNAQLTVSGGSEKIRYALIGGYFQQQGVVLNSGFKRYSLRVNLNADLSKRLKFGLNLAPSFTRRQIVNSDDTWSREGVIMTAIAISPHIALQNPDGTYPGQYNLGTPGFNAMINPVALATQYQQQSRDFTNTGRIFLNWEVLPGLVAEASLGTNVAFSAYNSYWPSYLGRGGTPPPSLPFGLSTSSLLLNWVNSNTLTYTRTFAEKHNLSFLVGNETQQQSVEDLSVRGERFPSDAAPWVSAAGQVTAGSGALSEWSLLSYFGRINYNFAGKYLLAFNIRRDGSSRFGTNRKWGLFPSASVGWQVMEEPFMQNLSNAVSDLKLRASYGVGGNNNIGDYAYRGLLRDQNYVLGAGLGELATGLAPIGLVNPDLRWETSRQLDIGTDARFLNDRLGLTVDFYNKLTNDLLLNVNVPRVTGYSQVLTNIGKVRNWGWEFTVNSRNLVGDRAGKLGWTTDFNLSFNRNQVLALGPNGDRILMGTSQIADSHVIEVGQPLGNFYGYPIEGVFNTQAEVDAWPKWTSGSPTKPGDYRFRDTNGDQKIDALDRTVIGNAFPDFIYGLTNTVSYRGFELMFLIQGVQGNEVLNGARRFIGTGGIGNNQYREVVEGAWKSPQEPGTGYARELAGATNNTINMNEKWLEDGSYLRLRNVMLSYDLPLGLSNRLGLRNARVYANVQNALTLTRYRGYNPEVSFAGRAAVNPGVDYGSYPLPRTLTFGVAVDF